MGCVHEGREGCPSKCCEYRLGTCNHYLVNAVTTDLEIAVNTELVNAIISNLANAVMTDLTNAMIADLVYASFVVHNSSLLFTSIVSQRDPLCVALPFVVAYADSFEPSHSQDKYAFNKSGNAIASLDASA